MATLSFPGILGLISIAALLWFALSTYTSYKRLAHIPGPLFAAIGPWWLMYHTLKGDIYIQLRRLHEEYGSPVRIAPNTISTSDPASFRSFVAPKSAWTRGEWFDGMKMDPKVDNILSMRDEAQHTVRRRQLIPGYQGVDVPTLEADIDAQLLGFKALIDKNVAGNKPFDMALFVHYFFLDVLTKISFGEALGYMKEGRDIFDYMKTSEDFFPVLELGLNIPFILAIMQSSVMQALGPKKSDRKGVGAIMGHAEAVIKQRFATGQKDNDIIGSFIKSGLTQIDLESELLILLLAGTDSTSTGLRMTLLHVMTNPLVYSKLQKEIDAESVRVTTPVITNAHAQTLPYLRAVILEGLRMFIPLQGLQGHKPPPGGAEMEGVWVPDQTEVGFAGYSMLYRKDLFGDDADTFNPDRWLGDSPKIAEMEKNQNIVFGSGRSSCLGKGIAMMELRKAVFEIFRAYDLVIVNPLTPVFVKSHGAVIVKNMLVRAHPRVKA